MSRDQEKGQSNGYEVDESKYRSLCGCHVKHCAMGWAIVQILLLACSLALNALSFVDLEKYSSYHRSLYNDDSALLLSISTGVNMLFLLLNCLVIYGIRKVKPYALIPIIAIQAIFLPLYIVAVIFFWGLILIVGLYIMIFYANFKTYQYLEDVKYGPNNAPNRVSPSAPVAKF